MDTETKITSARELRDLLRARYPVVYVVSSEEDRVEQELARWVLERRAKSHGSAELEARKMIVWTINDGFMERSWTVEADGTVRWGEDRKIPETDDPERALSHIRRAEFEALYVLRDFHPYLTNPKVGRAVRDLGRALREKHTNVVLLSPIFKAPVEIEKDLAVVDYDLPDREAVELTLDRFLSKHTIDSRADRVEGDPRIRSRVVEACLGLTLEEVEKVLAKSVIRSYDLLGEQDFDIDTILAEKRHIIRKSGILEFFESDRKFDDIGGLETLKDWLTKRERAFYPEAQRFGLPTPKGILLIGVPGCGKSLTAKSIGVFYKMPLLRLDVGRVFGSLVGSSEENMRKAIRTAEAVAPSILWLDELEKAFSGVQSSGQSDAGTTARVFGTFITWLQEKTSPVFVMATANDVSMLPPELMRKGRFDEIFFVDLPSPGERKVIVEIHIRRRGRNPEDFDIDKLVAATQGFSGSEIEQTIISAMYDVYEEATRLGDFSLDITTEAIVQSSSEIIPLSYTMKERIDHLREWARSRARKASAWDPSMDSAEAERAGRLEL